MQPVAVCVFAKPPVPGLVKTRIGRVVGHDLAAELAAALLADLLDVVRSVPWAVPVIASTQPDPAAFGVGPVEVWEQGEGELGARIERILRRGVERCGAAFAIGADTVGLSGERLELARRALREGELPIGPTVDGGFYLLGLDRCPEGLLLGLPWSTAATCAATEARLVERLGPVRRLPLGRDVDELEDLRAWLVEVDAGHAPEARASAVARRLLNAG